MTVLLPGGAGYIGSHTAVELLESGYDVIIIDDFSNSNKRAIDNIKKITGKNFKFYEVDYRNKEKVNQIFKKHKIDAVLNFAGFKAVGESVKDPLKYYDNNLIGAITLLEVMKEHNVKKFIFSSSATVYGKQDAEKMDETCKRGETTNPYGTTKSMIEKILEDLYTSDNSWDICILRYFNPVGAHVSKLLGEEPNGIPNNLMPYIVKVASGKLDYLRVFGNDYETKDGTGMRDYIHVVDLAKGHIKALEKLNREGTGIYYYNLGTGNAYSVLDMVKAFEKANKIEVPYQICPRRDGDIAIVYADPQKAIDELGWTAEKDLEDMCRDSWNFESNNI